MRRRMAELTDEVGRQQARAEGAELRAAGFEAAVQATRALLAQAHTRQLAAVEAERQTAAAGARELGEALLAATLAAEEVEDGLAARPRLLPARRRAGATGGSTAGGEGAAAQDTPYGARDVSEDASQGARDVSEDTSQGARDASHGVGDVSEDASQGVLHALHAALDASPLRQVRAELVAAVVEMRATMAASSAAGHSHGPRSGPLGEQDRTDDGGDAAGAGRSAVEALSSLLLKHNALLGREMARAAWLDAEARGLRRRLRDAEGAVVRHETERQVATCQLRLVQRQVRPHALQRVFFWKGGGKGGEPIF
eukprot:scaffold2682_cov90-Isochrysis_galbana.AAC.1